VIYTLVDTATLKTIPRTIDDLATTIVAGNAHHADQITQVVAVALDDLESKEIIRKRLDPDTHQHVWILDHDYLCRGVLEAERRANRWLILAQEGSRAFQEAGYNVRQRWRALLSPWQQTALAIQWLRGRFHYGTLRAYAMWGLLRFVPYLLILIGLGVGWAAMKQQQQAERDRNEAAQIRSSIGFYEDFSPIEVRPLGKLATSSDAIRDSFLQQALAFPQTAEQFNRRADMAIQAAVGLDPERRKKVWNITVFPCLQSPPADLNIKIACIIIGVTLSIENEWPKFASFVVETFIEAIKQNAASEQLDALANAIQAMAGKLAPADAQKVVSQLLASMERSTNPRQLDALAKAIQAMPSNLDRQTLVNLLKWPMSVGSFRATLLEILEKQANQKFDGSLWNMVTWAQSNGLDVKSPPRLPNKR
jgi:hypothetical protein